MTNPKSDRVENNLLPERSIWRNKTERATLAARMEHYRVPGASVAVISSGQIDWAQAYGICEALKPDPVLTTTRFQAGSISKLVTAAAVLRLVETGLLALDQDVNTYLKSWRVPTNGDWQPRITLRQLLSHSAGTTVNGFSGYPKEDPLPTLIQILNGEPPANSPPIYVNAIPGTQFRYSGGGTTIIQQLLVDLLDKPFPRIMRDLVLDPLGMTHSTYEQPQPGVDWPDAAGGHFWIKNRPVHGKWHIYPEMAAAGLWTTPTDLARFAIDLQQAFAGAPNKLLSTGIVTQMLTPQVEQHIGLGPFLSGSDDAASFGHVGSTHGYIAEVVASRRGGWGAAIITNSYLGESLINELKRAIATEYDWPDFTLKQHIVTDTNPASYAAYTGEYQIRPGLIGIISQQGETLTLRPGDQQPIALYPEGKGHFFMEGVDADLTFVMGKDEEPTAFTLRQGSSEIIAKKNYSPSA